RHLAHTYKMGPFTSGFVEVLAAQQTNETTNWYEGTADALRQNLRYIESERPRDVLILSGDQVYRMDFAALVAGHREAGADGTVAVVPVARERTQDLGVVRLDSAGRVTQLVEKPRGEAALEPLRLAPDWLRKHGLPPERNYLANMGIYLFKREALLGLFASRP